MGKIIGGSEYDTTYTVDVILEGGFIISGMTKSFGTGYDFNAWLVKVSDYENQRPNEPSKPKGRSKGIAGKEYTFSSSATDADVEQVYYAWDWGDGNYSYWLGPYSSGETCKGYYSWETEGNYNIRVKAKDVNGGESIWSDTLSITIPRKRSFFFNFNLLNWLLERFLILERLPNFL